MWGDGHPTRDFLFVEDAARGVVLAGEKYEGESIINLGSEQEISIKDLASTIAKIMNFSGQILGTTQNPMANHVGVLVIKKLKRILDLKQKFLWKMVCKKLLIGMFLKIIKIQYEFS